MTLAQYLHSSGTSQSDFAKRISVSRGYLNEILHGVKRPSLGVAFKIETASGGKVKAASFIEGAPGDAA